MNTLSQLLVGIILTIPLITLVLITIQSGYWSDYKISRDSGNTGYKAEYNPIFFYSLVIGVFTMWITWILALVLLSLEQYYVICNSTILKSQFDEVIQFIGIILFLVGSTGYNLTLLSAGKYLRPAPSGTLADHKLIRNGPYRIIRHPLYTSYIFILIGLCLMLLQLLLSIPICLLIIGMYPTAQAEEKVLKNQFGITYSHYQDEVGMFFPKVF